MHRFIHRSLSCFKLLEQSRVLLAISHGMLVALPITITASFALLITNFPVPAFRFWLENLFGGAAYHTLSLVQNASSNIISLVFLLSISFSFERSNEPRVPGLYPMTALCSYIAFLSGPHGQFSFERFSSQWISHAIVIAILSSILLEKLIQLQKTSPRKNNGESSLFYALLNYLLPIACTVLCFAFLNVILSSILQNPDVQELLSSAILTLFKDLGRSIPSALLFIFVLHIFWFFGVHGGILFELLSRQFFIPGTQMDLASLSNPSMEGQLRTFIDTFVLLGGCGSVMCLVLAVLIAEKRRSQRTLAKLSLLPVLCNINELIIFGIPIAFNPIYLIPFLLTPIVLTLSSYAFVLLGLVPQTVYSVDWTTPLFLSGYVATGSITGVLLQGFNLILGVLLYLPFVHLSQHHHKMSTKQQVDQLASRVQEGELVGKLPKLLNPDSSLYGMAHILADDLAYAISANTLQIYYQPQVDDAGRLAGAEALLRWEYFQGTFLYPPLIIALAEEAGLQRALGERILRTICTDMESWRVEHGLEIPISFNVTASLLEESSLPETLLALREQHGIAPGLLGVEITEQAALSLSADVEACLESLREAGAKILLDDFGMGHSSMMYLQNNHFDIVKLDGSLTRQILTNPRSQDIIASIIYLSRSLLFDVCAEYVETEEQTETLRKLGCQKFQGYLYSPPIEKTKFLAFAKSLHAAHETIQQRLAAKS